MNEFTGGTHESLNQSSEERKSTTPINKAEEMGVLTQEVEGGNAATANAGGANKQDFTEVFSWGSDRFGQLGLGKQVNT